MGAIALSIPISFSSHNAIAFLIRPIADRPNIPLKSDRAPSKKPKNDRDSSTQHAIALFLSNRDRPSSKTLEAIASFFSNAIASLCLGLLISPMSA